MALDFAWPGAVTLESRYVSTSLPPRTATQVRRSTIFQTKHPPRRRATRDRGSVVGDGVIPALLFD